MKYQNKKHISFDLDDTLTDSYSFNQDMFVDTFKKYTEINPIQDGYLRQLHKSSRGVSMLDQFLSAVNYLEIKVTPAELVVYNEQLHTQKAHQINAFPSTISLLEELTAAGKTLSICSNRQTESLNKILEQNKIKRYFTDIISCADAGYEKPHPFCLNKLVETSELTKSDFLYIGDSSTDENFARNAGVDFEYIELKKL